MHRLLTIPVPCLAKLENYDDVTFADEETEFEIFGVVTHVVNDMSLTAPRPEGRGFPLHRNEPKPH